MEDTGDPSNVGRVFLTVSDNVRGAQYDITDEYKACELFDSKEERMYKYAYFFGNDSTKNVGTWELHDSYVIDNFNPAKNYDIRYYGYDHRYSQPLKEEKRTVNNTICYCETLLNDPSRPRSYCFALDDTEGMKLLYIIDEWGDGQYRRVYRIDECVNKVKDWTLLQIPEGYEIIEDTVDTGMKTEKDNYPNR